MSKECKTGSTREPVAHVKRAVLEALGFFPMIDNEAEKERVRHVIFLANGGASLDQRPNRIRISIITCRRPYDKEHDHKE
ncbi:MAG: hypothetical protein Q7R54_03480 [bacterium]|nr:hypothetical protein [bacterium]